MFEIQSIYNNKLIVINKFWLARVMELGHPPLKFPYWLLRLRMDCRVSTAWASKL